MVVGGVPVVVGGVPVVVGGVPVVVGVVTGGEVVVVVSTRSARVTGGQTVAAADGVVGTAHTAVVSATAMISNPNPSTLCPIQQRRLPQALRL